MFSLHKNCKNVLDRKYLSLRSVQKVPKSINFVKTAITVILQQMLQKCEFMCLVVWELSSVALVHKFSEKMLSPYLIYVCFAAFTIVLSANAMHKEKKNSTCRESSIFQNFNATRFLGLWYLYSRHHHDFEDGCDCFTSEVVALDATVTSFQTTNCCQMTKISNATQRCNLSVNHSRLTNPEKKDANFMYTRTGGKIVWSLNGYHSLAIKFIV